MVNLEAKRIGAIVEASILDRPQAISPQRTHSPRH
jgi:hypothetical protein